MAHVPQRSCVGCRTVRAKRELVRIVRTPDDRFVLDATGRQPGRGAYLCPSSACLALAVRRNSFERAFRQSLSRETVAALEAEIQQQLGAGNPAPGSGIRDYQDSQSAPVGGGRQTDRDQ